MRGGYIMRDEDHKKKNGNGKKSNGSSNGHGNGSNGNGNGGNQSSNGGSSNGSNGGGGVSESTYMPRKTGNIITAMLAWRGSQYSIQMFFPHIKTPSRREVQDQVRKVYPGAKLWVIPSFEL